MFQNNVNKSFGIKKFFELQNSVNNRIKLAKLFIRFELNLLFSIIFYLLFGAQYLLGIYNFFLSLKLYLHSNQNKLNFLLLLRNRSVCVISILKRLPIRNFLLINCFRFEFNLKWIPKEWSQISIQLQFGLLNAFNLFHFHNWKCCQNLLSDHKKKFLLLKKVFIVERSFYCWKKFLLLKNLNFASNKSI